MSAVLSIVAKTLIATISIAIGAYCIVFGLFRDRPRGRMRCSKCWYIICEGLRCPECGYRVRSTKELKRTRRHWLQVGVGLGFLVISYTTVNLSRIIEHPVIGFVPTTLLTIVGPNMYSANGVLWSELWRRLMDKEAWKWQRKIFARRLLAYLQCSDCAEFTPALAIECLSYLGDDAMVAYSDILAATGNSNADIRATAIEAIGRLDIADSSAMDVSMKLLRDEQEEVRSVASWALSRLVSRAPEIIQSHNCETLEQYLDDENMYIRINIASALIMTARCQNKRAIETLEGLLSSNDPTVRFAAAVVLKRTVAEDAHQGR